MLVRKWHAKRGAKGGETGGDGRSALDVDFMEETLEARRAEREYRRDALCLQGRRRIVLAREETGHRRKGGGPSWGRSERSCPAVKPAFCSVGRGAFGPHGERLRLLLGPGQVTTARAGTRGQQALQQGDRSGC
jgi:hypothetical protein